MSIWYAARERGNRPVVAGAQAARQAVTVWQAATVQQVVIVRQTVAVRQAAIVWQTVAVRQTAVMWQAAIVWQAAAVRQTAAMWQAATVRQAVVVRRVAAVRQAAAVPGTAHALREGEASGREMTVSAAYARAPVSLCRHVFFWHLCAIG